MWCLARMALSNIAGQCYWLFDHGLDPPGITSGMLLTTPPPNSGVPVSQKQHEMWLRGEQWEAGIGENCPFRLWRSITRAMIKNILCLKKSFRFKVKVCFIQHY